MTLSVPNSELRMGKKDRNRATATPTSTTSAASPDLFDPRVFPRSVELLKIAETDRRAAEALHQQQLYPQAVFALQQAVEKTVKAVGLATRVISASELQSAISHKAINVFLFAMRKIREVGNGKVTDQKAIAMLEGYIRAGESARDRFTSTAKPTEAELEQWISAHRFP